MNQNKELEINVLDHGLVRLCDYMGTDLSIVRAARVSYNADWRDGQGEQGGNETSKDEKLIGYLLRNRHTSPFESVVFTFEIKCPMFVARQWHRHRTWSYNEVSARYTELPDEYYIPAQEVIGKQSKSSKQARDIVPMGETLPPEDFKRNEQIRNDILLAADNCFSIYKMLISDGCPRELARSVLPLATYTRFFGTVNLHNLMHFLRLRLHPHAQYEIRVYAEAIKEIISHVVPVTMKYFEESLKEITVNPTQVG